MSRTMRNILAAGLLGLAALTLTTSRADAAQPDLFYNYYVGPPAQAGTYAQLYICPRPTPPLVGHTWVTYPPFNPHESLYHHKRTYYKYNPQNGYTSTSIRWY